MERLECPVDGCSAVIEATSEEEVMNQVETHAAEDHPDMELDEETTEDIRSQIMTI